VIICQSDPWVSVTETKQIVASLRQEKVPVWYMNALNEGHGYRKKVNQDVYQQTLMLFFQQYLLGQ